MTQQPIEAVLFDLHSTLLDQGAGAVWARAAARRLAIPESDLADPRVLTALDTLWDDAKTHDPGSRRDLSALDHRRVFDELIAAAGLTLPRPVLDALYAEQFAAWHAYDDTVPTLRALREAGVRVAVVSNICHDVRWLLEREGVLHLVDTVVLSFEVGVVKPDRSIFTAALDGLGDISPQRALMVGDSWRDDGAAAGHGIRSLVLPRTAGREHGLAVVVGAVLATRNPLPHVEGGYAPYRCLPASVGGITTPETLDESDLGALEDLMAVGPIGQIHVSVTDLDRSVAFYRDVLGLRHLFTVPGQAMAFFMAGSVRLYLAVPDDESFRSRPVIYYRVEDLPAEFDGIVQRGAVVLSAPHRVHRDAAAELWMAFVADPDGTPIGLMAERPVGPQA